MLLEPRIRNNLVLRSSVSVLVTSSCLRSDFLSGSDTETSAIFFSMSSTDCFICKTFLRILLSFSLSDTVILVLSALVFGEFTFLLLKGLLNLWKNELFLLAVTEVFERLVSATCMSLSSVVSIRSTTTVYCLLSTVYSRFKITNINFYEPLMY